MADSSFPSLTELVSVRTLQRLQDSFAEALGITAVILDLTGNPITKGRYHSEALSKYFLTNRANALKAVERMKTYIFECDGKVFYFSVPIIVEGHCIGLIFGGQVRLGNPDLQLCKKRAEFLEITFDEYLEQYLSLPLFSRDRLVASADILKMVSSTISTMAFAGKSAQKQIEEVMYTNDLLEEEVKRKTNDLESIKDRYQMILENADDVICTVDTKGIVTSVNSIVKSLLGFDPEEIIGHPVWDFFRDDDEVLAKAQAAFDEAIKGNKKHLETIEFYVRKKTGEIRRVEMNARIVFDDKGNFLEVEGILRDITKAHEFELRLRESEKRYRLLFENASEAIFLINGEGKFLTVNKAMVDFMGYSEISDLQGKDSIRFVPSELHETYRKIIEKLSNYPIDASTLMNIIFLSREQTHIFTEVRFTRISERLYMGIARGVPSRRGAFSTSIFQRLFEKKP